MNRDNKFYKEKLNNCIDLGGGGFGVYVCGGDFAVYNVYVNWMIMTVYLYLSLVYDMT